MKRRATAVWSGALGDGKGTVTTQSGALSDHGYSFKARFEDESGKAGTNPEELMAASHAGCFAMQLSHFLAENGTPADELKTTAEVNVEEVSDGFEIKASKLTLDAKVPKIDEAKFKELCEQAKNNCPVSKALGKIEISLDAKLN